MDSSSLRKEMVRKQIIARGIKDARVIQALQKVPRHKFVPKKYLDSAYGDYPLSIGAGQTISQPYMVALMSQCLQLKGKETVLEIGTGSGYQTAILAELANYVYSLERVMSLAKTAERVLKNSGYRNLQIKAGDGTMGWPEYAPYKGIIVTAAAPEIPKALLKQLDVEGKLVMPIGESFNQILTVVNKYKNKTEVENICGCVFVPLIGKYV